MAFRNSVDQLLVSPAGAKAAAVLFEALLDFRVCGARTLEIAFVHYHDICEVEHHDLLQLQPASVIRIHHQHGRIDYSVLLKRHRLLASAHRLDDDVIEIRPRQKSQAIMRCARESASLPTRCYASHEHAVILRIDHCGAIAKQRAFANNAGIMGQDRNPPIRISVEKPQDELVNQRGFSCAARPSETDDTTSP